MALITVTSALLSRVERLRMDDNRNQHEREHLESQIVRILLDAGAKQTSPSAINAVTSEFQIWKDERKIKDGVPFCH